MVEPSTMYSARAKLNALQRHRDDGDPAIDAARADLRQARRVDDITRHVESLVKADPPLSIELRTLLAIMLLTGGES